MKYDLIIAGVGGQGILSIAAILGRAAMAAGLRVKQSEVHGMAQRGGAVQSHFRMAEREIFSDVIPLASADLVLAMEPMEALRQLPGLAAEGWLIANDECIRNMADYPSEAEIRAALAAWPRHYVFDATRVAAEAGAARAMNMALLGAASVLLPIEERRLMDAMAEQFSGKGDKVIAANAAAFAAARALAAERRRAVTEAG